MHGLFICPALRREDLEIGRDGGLSQRVVGSDGVSPTVPGNDVLQVKGHGREDLEVGMAETVASLIVL